MKDGDEATDIHVELLNLLVNVLKTRKSLGAWPLLRSTIELPNGQRIHLVCGVADKPQEAA
jgi:hypothetical protein